MKRRGPAKPPVHLVVPGPIETLTGGFIYDRRIVDALRHAGRLGALICLDGDYPRPTAKALDADVKELAMIDADGPLVIDGLALTALWSHGHALPTDRAMIALVHHALCDETGLSADDIAIAFDSERQALTHAAGCIVTSPSTGRRLADFDVPREHVRVVVPGLDQPASRPIHTNRDHNPVRLLCVATLSPRKGQDILLTALADLADLEWRLDLVGAARDPGFSTRIKSMISALALEDRVRLHGEIASACLDAHYRDADIFVLPSHHEGFGMALSEAMAHGLPIISTRAGAIPETVPGDAGDLVPPGDAPALAASLRRLIRDPIARATAGAAARRTAACSPSWAKSGADFIAAVDDLLEINPPGLAEP
jgi:glycosyltransferase involved in cell wall biosynthesis